MKPFAIAISEYVGNYLPNTRRYSPNTIRSYCRGLVEFMEFFESFLGKAASSLKPEDLTYDLADAYIRHLQGKGLSESSVIQRMGCLRAFVKWLAKTDISYLAAREAICASKPPKAPEAVIAWLTLEEMKLLLSLPDPKTLAGLRDLVILTVLYETGARCQELCDLDVEHVNLTTRTIVLRGKGRKTRTVPISRDAAAIVRRHFEQTGESSRQQPLVTGRGGCRITPSGVQYVIAKYVAKGRLQSQGRLLGKKITPHVFRHSRAMHMLEAGVEIIYIRDFLGHSSVRTTEIYARANPEAKRAAIDRHTEALGIRAGRMSAEREQNIIEKVRAMSRATR